VDTFTRGRVGEVGLRGNFATGSVAHQLVLSATSLNVKDGSANRASQGWAQNIYNPVAPVLPAPPSPAQVGNDNVMSSLGLADTLTMVDGKVLLTLGARLQRVEQKLEQYEESKVSPSVGVVVKPWGANTSLYANYMEGLSPGENVAATGYTNSGDSLKPIQTRQAELGMKLRQGSFTHTFSAFQITKPTAVDQANATGSPTRVEGGKQDVKGLEWITFGKATASLSLLGGVTYQQADFRDTGRDSYGVPDWAANIGAEWTTSLTGLSFSGRVVYNGKQWVDSANTLQLPSSTRLDVGAKYITALASTPVTLNAFVENVTGRDYWSGMFSDGYVMSGPPRTLRLAATFSF
jgi:iron complex outermembrane recepter protein